MAQATAPPMTTRPGFSEFASERVQKTLNEQLRFEQLLSDISATFVSLDLDQINKEIPKALERISKVLGSDVSTFLQPSEKTGKLEHTHQWVSPSVTLDIDFTKADIYEKAPWVAKQLLGLEPIVVSCLDDFPEDATKERALAESLGLKSVLWVPIAVDGIFTDCIALNSLRQEVVWSQAVVQRLRLLGEVFGTALRRAQTERQLQQAYQRIEEFKDRLEAENFYLKKEIQEDYSQEGILGHSEAIKSVLSQVEQVANTGATVLISGETGTGKELIAKAIHKQSARREQVMLKVNCGALPASLIEAELFGREKGAYTGAVSKQIGRFELADHSTIFLDEITELPFDLQAKLLRVLQEGEFERLGSSQTIKVDVRVITATNQDIAKAMRDGSFREDLYYRLNVFPIAVPALRERREDIPVLVWAFVQEFAEKMGKKIEVIHKATLASLQSYDWPGNVRELRNVIERAIILSRDNVLRVDLSTYTEDATSSNLTLPELEKRHIEDALKKTGWRISGKRGAAEVLGLKPTTLRSKMDKLGIHRSD